MSSRSGNHVQSSRSVASTHLRPFALADDDVEETVHVLSALKRGSSACRMHMLVGPPRRVGDALDERRERTWWRGRAPDLGADETALAQYETAFATTQGTQRVLLTFVARTDALSCTMPAPDELRRQARAIVDALRRRETKQ